MLRNGNLQSFVLFSQLTELIIMKGETEVGLALLVSLNRAASYVAVILIVVKYSWLLQILICCFAMTLVVTSEDV